MEEVDSGELVTVGHHKDRASEKVTTRTQLRKEGGLLSGLLTTAKETAPAPGLEFVQAAIAAEEERLRRSRGSGACLNEEQKAAIAYLVDPVRWAALEGFAGAGKTSCCRPVVDAYRRAGLVDKVILVRPPAAPPSHRRKRSGRTCPARSRGCTAWCPGAS